MNYYVYILGSNGLTLYIGVTNNIVKRVYEHKNQLVEGFTQRYNIHKLLYFEIFTSPEEAIEREKLLKHWNRQWKLNLIKQSNPEYLDLYSTIL